MQNSNKLKEAPVKRNIVANFAASLLTTLLNIAFVPLYIDFMGIEAYGLVGIFVTLFSVFNIFDLGLSTTINREVSRLSCFADKSVELWDVVRTLEMVYLGITAFIGLLLFVLVPFLSHYWIEPEELSPSTVLQAFILMGMILVFRWPSAFYSGGLMGLQRQVLLCFVNSGFAIAQSFGAIYVLWLVSPTIQAFFMWQLLITITLTLSLAFLLRKNLPRVSGAPHFRKEHLLKVGRFAAGMTAVSILGIIIIQLDKIILSKMLSLKTYGYYMLANLVAISLFRIVTPIYTAVFPHFTQLVANNNQFDLREQYHKGSQLLSVAILPTMIVLAFFSYEFMFVWTGNVEVAANTHKLVTLLAISYGFYGLTQIPWALQLAYGWTRLGLCVNLLAVLTIIPLIIVLVMQYGAIGAAATWCGCSFFFYFILQPTLMYRRLLQGEAIKWYLIDVGRPFLAALCVAVLGRLLVSGDASRVVLLLELAIISCFALLAAILSTPATREWSINRLRNYRCPAPLES